MIFIENIALLAFGIIFLSITIVAFIWAHGEDEDEG